MNAPNSLGPSRNSRCTYLLDWRNLENMDAAPQLLQKRNVEVFDHEGGVIAGTTLSLITILSLMLTACCRVLAVWYSPVGRVLPILNRIRRC